MKTNLAILIIAFSIATTWSSRAYNLTIGPGYNLIAHQLDDPFPIDNSLNNIMPSVPDGTTLFKWNHTAQSYFPVDTFFTGLGWFDSSFNPSTTALEPGEAAFVFSPDAASISIPFSGTPRTVPPSPPVPLVPGWNFISCQAPQSAGYNDIVGAPPVHGTCFFQYDYPTQPSPVPPLPTCSSLDPGGWILHVFLNGNWYRVNSLNNLTLSAPPTAQTGEGVVIYVIQDNVPPVLNCSVSVSSMISSANSFQNVGLNITATDNCAASPTVTVKVYSDEAAPLGFSPDATYVSGVLSLRRERSGSGDGRVYLIVVTATDSFGNTAFCCQTVVVPHDTSAVSQASVNAQAAAVLSTCGPGGSPLTPNLIL